MNQLSIQLTNEAMARGLRLAAQYGVSSLEGLIEHLLLNSPDQELTPAAPSPTSAAHPATASTSAMSALPAPPPDGAPLGSSAVFEANLPALTFNRPASRPDLRDAPAEGTHEPLPFLTNRLSPLKAAVRALANLAIREGEWPRLRDFQAQAAHAARERGLALRAEDQAAGRRGRLKRSVAWPVGANPASALDRYVFAFTIAQEAGRPSGPLATLGLAGLVEGRAALTSTGWELALAESPLLDAAGSGMLGVEEVRLFRGSLTWSAPERQAIAEFVKAVKRAAGIQPRVDELLATWHADWTADQAAAQRSAMIGRLEELGAIEVAGRGSKATITLVDVENLDGAITERNAA